MSIAERHFEALRAKYPAATCAANPDGSAVVIIPDVALPAGWNAPTATVVFVAPAGYPQAAPDCFWTNPGVALVHGGAPQNTGQNHQPGVPPNWLWFSWHPSTWSSNADNFETYLNVIRQRLHQVR